MNPRFDQMHAPTYRLTANALADRYANERLFDAARKRQRKAAKLKAIAAAGGMLTIEKGAQAET